MKNVKQNSRILFFDPTVQQLQTQLMSQENKEAQEHKNKQPEQLEQDLCKDASPELEADAVPGALVEEEQYKQQCDDEKIAEIPYNTIVCSFCNDLIISTIQTVCGHAFCQFCLTEYLLVSKQCPICGLPIREKKGAANKRLDLLIEQFCQFLGQQEFQGFKQRKQYNRAIKEQKKQDQRKFRLENGRAGALVDIRDDEYVWRKGRIIRTFNRVNSDQSRIKFLIVQYLDTEKKEQLLMHSARLARPGHYTDRKDLPKYKMRRPDESDRSIDQQGEQVGQKKQDKPQNEKEEEQAEN